MLGLKNTHNQIIFFSTCEHMQAPFLNKNESNNIFSDCRCRKKKQVWCVFGHVVLAYYSVIQESEEGKTLSGKPVDFDIKKMPESVRLGTKIELGRCVCSEHVEQFLAQQPLPLKPPQFTFIPGIRSVDCSHLPPFSFTFSLPQLPSPQLPISDSRLSSSPSLPSSFPRPRPKGNRRRSIKETTKKSISNRCSLFRRGVKNLEIRYGLTLFSFLEERNQISKSNFPF